MISVHAISMVYELRALRSRLSDMLLLESEIFQDPRREREILWMLDMIELLLNKIERTGEYIAHLEETLGQAEGPEETDLGPEQR